MYEEKHTRNGHLHEWHLKMHSWTVLPYIFGCTWAFSNTFPLGTRPVTTATRSRWPRQTRHDTDRRRPTCAVRAAALCVKRGSGKWAAALSRCRSARRAHPPAPRIDFSIRATADEGAEGWPRYRQRLKDSWWKWYANAKWKRLLVQRFPGVLFGERLFPDNTIEILGNIDV